MKVYRGERRPFHGNRKPNLFIAQPILDLHILAPNGIRRKACQQCLREQKLDQDIKTSGRINERCLKHPQEYLWLAGSFEEWDRFREFVNQIRNPADPAIITQDWEVIGGAPKP